MQRRRKGWTACLLGGAAALAPGLLAPRPAGAHQPVPVGAQFQVNSHTTGQQNRPVVAMDPDGDFVVLWTGPGVEGRRYASSGSALGPQFQVNTYTTSGYLPSVAADADGDFVVAWTSNGSFGTDTSYRSIQGQRYASDGSAQGGQFQVNTYTTNRQVESAVAADADGDFVVTWTSMATGVNRGIQAQRYASDGSPLGAQFQVSTYTTVDSPTDSSVTADADGDFVVVWRGRSFGTDSSELSIQGQRYASDGSPRGAHFQVNTYTTSYQRHPSVAADAAGDFVVVWDSYRASGDSYYSIQGQRYASDGSAQGAQFQVNTYTTYSQQHPSVAVDADGDFLVAWQGAWGVSPFGDFSGFSIHAQRYASDGSAQGAEFEVNTYTTNHQDYPSVALDANSNNFVVVWRSQGSPGNDTSFQSIQAQRYFLLPTAVPAMAPATRFSLAAALLVLGAACALKRRAELTRLSGFRKDR